MSSILFVTWDGGGNVPPALGIAARMRARGHDIRVLGHPQQRDAIESAGLEFEPYRHARPWSSTDRTGGPAWALKYLAMFTDRGTGTDLIESVARRKTDAVVVDCMMLGALKAAQKLGLPRAALVHTLYDYVANGWSKGPLGMVAAVKGVSPAPLWTAADRIIVTTAPDLEPTSPLPPNLRVTGPVFGGPAPIPYQVDGARVLVSLSTIHYNGQIAAIQSIMDAVADLPVPVVLTTGHAIAPEEIRAPQNVDVHRFLSHAEIMPKVSLVVGHGGHSTTMLALAHDLPLVIMPMFNLVDQPLIGDVVRRHGAGVVVKRNAKAAQIQAAIAAMLTDGPHRAAAARLGTHIRQSDGADRAADEIEAMAAR